MIARLAASVALVHLMTPQPASAQVRMCTLEIRGQVTTPQIGTMTVSNESGGVAQCIPVTDSGALCKAPIACDARDAVFTLNSAGFKTYRRNIPRLEFRERAAVANVGQVRLDRSERLSIAQIVRSTGKDGEQRFQIVLHNPLKREVFIRALTLTAERKPDDVSCHGGGEARFLLHNDIRIEPASGQWLVTGSFQETSRAPGFDTKAVGFASIELCRHEAMLTLRLATAFTIPATEYSSIDLLLPRRFDVKVSGLSESSRVETYQKLLASLSLFESMVFRFEPDRGGDVEGRYFDGRFNP